MALAPGTRVGAYEVTAQIGVGGMGEVYRARDLKLGRNVALKVLPDLFVADPDRLARFQREAEILAALNHPHIAAIHGIEDAGGLCALVLELVEGETLADRIARGPIPIDEALPTARQIADALEAAHEQGIIHRDLKPANIKITPEGVVKVLDFGLAKVTGPSARNGSSAGAGLSQSPTITSPAMMTGVGVILGTAAYMSPEQSKGRAADKRSDVWAFGCVLYEMMTGRRAFYGDDVADTLAAVLKSEPDWTALPSDVPPSMRALIQGCLRKDRKERIGDISAARFVLQQPHTTMQSNAVASGPRWGRAIAVFAAVLLGVAVVASALFKRSPSPVPPIRFAITLPQGQQLTPNRNSVALSPDGTRVVYAAEGRLFLRSMSELEARAIPGTESARNPVFSPDGQRLAFWADSALKRIPVSGGTALTICPLVANPTSVAWSSDDDIFFTPGATGTIMRVSPNGGKPMAIVDLKSAGDEAFGPQLLPDGRTLLFTIVRRPTSNLNRWDAAAIGLQSLDADKPTILIEGGIDARYVPTGHIVYAYEGTLFAVPFDLAKLKMTGGAVPVVEGVRRGILGTGGAHYAFSQSGVLVYVAGPAAPTQQDLVLFDRNGHVEQLKLPPGKYDSPRVSPDGKRIAFQTTDGKNDVVSIYELGGGSSIQPLTSGGNNRYPIWLGDGQVTFQSNRGGDFAIWRQPAEGGMAERLTTAEPGTSHVPESWSPDGNVLLFSATKDLVSSLWTYSVKDKKAALFSDVTGSSLPTDATFSPDGHWIAYQMGEMGGGEGFTYVAAFPATGTKRRLSMRGGRPLWSRITNELFFVPSATQFMAVTVRTEPTFTFMTPVSVPRGFGISNPASPRAFDMLPDGRIVGVAAPGQTEGESRTAEIVVVLNWFDELKRLGLAR